MPETVTLVGQGGSEFVFDLPLRPPYDDQLAKGHLRPRGPEDRALLAAQLPDEEDEPVEAAERVATVDEILTSVGDNPERAQTALEAERARGEEARSTLIRALEKISDEVE